MFRSPPSATPAYAPPYPMWLVLAAALLAAAGCGSSTLDDFEPELAKDATGKVAPITIELIDYRSQPPLYFTLSNASNERAQRAKQAGRLPMTHKVVDDETVGQVVAFMRERNYFEYARPVGNTETALPANTRRTLLLMRGGEPTLRMVELRLMGQQPGGREQVQAISDMSKVIRAVSNQNLALRVDSSGKTISDLLNQPGLRGGR